jgi:hypothetical protein
MIGVAHMSKLNWTVGERYWLAHGMLRGVYVNLGVPPCRYREDAFDILRRWFDSLPAEDQAQALGQVDEWEVVAATDWGTVAHGRPLRSERVKAQIKIIVNGRWKTVAASELSFAEVVALAFDAPPRAVPTVTYRRAGKPLEGMLAEGQTVQIRDGTIFDVVVTDNA